MNGNRNDNRLDDVLDRALAGIRDESAADDVLEASAARVRSRLASAIAAARAENAETLEIRSCEDFRKLIPAWLDGTLTDARRLLLEDHGRECVPCRKAMKVARAQRQTGGVAARADRPRRSRRWGWKPDLGWGLAAAAAVLIALVGVAVRTDVFRFETGGLLKVETVEGTLFRVSDLLTTPVEADEDVADGKPVRTAKDSGATLRLEDGSRVEMNERSEIRVSRRGRDQTIHLLRGDVIVEAAPQGSGHLYVQTADCKVAVRGTVFAVSTGLKGSRVSVLEGEVRVDRRGHGTEVLRPGEQTTTSPAIDRVPVEQDIAWSRDLDRHLALLGELSAFRKELDRQLPRPELRHSTRLLDRAPDGTVLYVAIPNLASSLTRAHELLMERVRSNDVLRRWWDDSVVASGAAPKIETAIEKIRDFGDALGDEIVVTLQKGPGSELRGPVVLSTLRDPDSFRALLEREVAEIGTSTDGRAPIRVVDDPATASDEGAELTFWISGDLVAASPRLDDLRRLAAAGSDAFAASPFRRAIADVYGDGAGMIFAADLHAIVGGEAHDDATLDALGLADMRYLIVERHANDAARNVTHATLTFDRQRRGVAAWLAAPAPMGALEFVSPDATAAAAFVVKSPAAAVDELIATLGADRPELRDAIAKFEAENSIDVVRDFAAPLGGELVFALDGPVLPKPAWKAIVEVYDEAALQHTIEWTVEKLDEHVAELGGSRIELRSERAGDRTYWTLASDKLGVLATWTYAEGYLVAAPQRALVDRALAYRESRANLARSARFASLLPEDGRIDASAVLYQNFSGAMQSILRNVAGRVGSLSADQRARIDALADDAEPSVFCAYGDPDRIVMVGSDRGGLLGGDFGNLLTLGGVLSLGDTLERAASEADASVYDGAGRGNR